MITSRLAASALLLLSSTLSVPATAAAQLREDFTQVGTLPAEGWVFIDRSTPLGFPDWFQGLPASAGFFDANSPPADAYIASAFSSVDLADVTAQVFTLSNWLLTPEVTLLNGASFTFFTRTALPDADFPDRLQLLLSTSGASTNVGSSAESVGDFNFSGGPLLDINPNFTPDGYPAEWTSFSVTLSNLAEPASGRFGFRHFAADAQTQGSFVGVDDVSYLASPMRVPEPSSWLLLLAGTAGFSAIARRRGRSAG